MEVFELPGDRSRFVWSEQIELPLGALGKIGWTVVRPAFALGVQRSLDQFAQLVSTNQL